MFNDRYGLTQAVIEGRKTMAMMLINIKSTSDVQVRIFAGYVQIIGRSGDVCAEKKLSYKVGEVVAVAQRYQDIFDYSNCVNPYAWEDDDKPSGWTNKMLTKAELMPHQIRITGIKCEREELTRWRNPNEELPENNSCVLMKVSDGEHERIYLGARQDDVWMCDGGYSFCQNAEECLGYDGVVIGWRPIYENE